MFQNAEQREAAQQDKQEWRNPQEQRFAGRARPIQGEFAIAHYQEFGDLLTGPTVVSVYMRNNTSGCDLQMASLAKAKAEAAG